MFENQLSSIVFLLATLGMSYSEIKRYNNLITPFTVSAFPIVTITILVNFVFVNFNIKPVTLRVNFFLLMCLTLIWIVGFFYHKNFKPAMVNGFRENPYFLLLKEFESYKYLLVFLSLIIAFVTYGRVKTLTEANGGWIYLGTNEFENDMTSGIVAHIIIFGKAAFIVLFLLSAKSKYKRFTYPALFLFALCVFILMVKYNLLWLIMIIFFINNLNLPVKLQVRKILTIITILFIVFILYFIFLSLFWSSFSLTSLKVWEYLYRTFLSYFLTGPIVLDFWLDFPSVKPDYALFSVLLNIQYVFLGNPFRLNNVNLVATRFYNVGSGMDSNIGTSFGVYYLIGGIPLTICITILFAAISYFVYVKGIKGNNLFYSFFNWFFLALNALNFFAQFFTLFAFYILPVFFFSIIMFLYLIKYVMSILSGKYMYNDM